MSAFQHFRKLSAFRRFRVPKFGVRYGSFQTTTRGFSTAQLEVLTVPTGGKRDHEHFVMIRVRAPDELQRTPVNVCLVVDVSGSMASNASVKTASGDESYGLTRLDVVKHTVLTIAEVLGEEDQISIVTFNRSAKTLMELAPANQAGKQRVKDIVDSLHPGLWLVRCK